MNTLKYIDNKNCIKIRKTVPNLNPYISYLSQYSSQFNTAIRIDIYGKNFLPNGLTKVDFGNIQNINIKFINPSIIYFELYNFAFPGVYNIIVKNQLLISAKNTTANSVNGLVLKSNIVEYTILE
jgi:hypothetical protein